MIFEEERYSDITLKGGKQQVIPVRWLNNGCVMCRIYSQTVGWHVFSYAAYSPDQIKDASKVLNDIPGISPLAVQDNLDELGIL